MTFRFQLVPMKTWPSNKKTCLHRDLSEICFNDILSLIQLSSTCAFLHGSLQPSHCAAASMACSRHFMLARRSESLSERRKAINCTGQRSLELVSNQQIVDKSGTDCELSASLNLLRHTNRLFFF